MATATAITTTKTIKTTTTSNTTMIIQSWGDICDDDDDDNAQNENHLVHQPLMRRIVDASAVCAICGCGRSKELETVYEHSDHAYQSSPVSACSTCRQAVSSGQVEISTVDGNFRKLTDAKLSTWTEWIRFKTKSDPICYFFQLHKCTYGDECNNRHVPATDEKSCNRVCSFFLKGTCTRGDDCPYTHDDLGCGSDRPSTRQQRRKPPPRLPKQVVVVPRTTTTKQRSTNYCMSCKAVTQGKGSCAFCE